MEETQTGGTCWDSCCNSLQRHVPLQVTSYCDVQLSEQDAADADHKVCGCGGPKPSKTYYTSTILNMLGRPYLSHNICIIYILIYMYNIY